MRALFRAFEVRRVRALVIGGQASILYGAAHFSQDLDLWIDPAGDNVRRFVDALEALRARVHKLTPPLAGPFLRRGHGFHFLIPQRGGAVYLDVMGRPPRVGGFGAAWGRREVMATPWGRLPVVSIPDLVELKKTNRPADYDVITRLAMIRVAREESPGPALLRWAFANLFRVEDVLELLQRFGGTGTRRWRGLLGRDGRPSPSEIDAAARKLGAEAQRLQALGRRYWTVRIAELRRLRSEGRLLPEGTRVTRALALRP